jgi:hypothetical protein
MTTVPGAKPRCCKSNGDMTMPTQTLVDWIDATFAHIHYSSIDSIDID